MADPCWYPLLSLPPYPAERFAPLADRLARLLMTKNDLLLIQGEAMLALESVAVSLSRPGMHILNVVTSPYGLYFSQWLRRGGAEVHDVKAPSGYPITPAAFDQALDAMPTLDAVVLAHGEAASGIVNPLSEIAARVRQRQALLVVDAVASVGGHTLDVDGLGIDIAVIGPQKALGGPAGLSAVSVSARAWLRLMTPAGYAQSCLSLTELKRQWLDRGRGALPGTPSAGDFWALESALDRLENEGLVALINRHLKAAQATRAGLRALGVVPWVSDEACASSLVTAAPVPEDVDTDALIADALALGAAISPGVGVIAHQLVRLHHSGIHAVFPSVLTNVVAYGAALARHGCPADVAAAAAVITHHYLPLPGAAGHQHTEPTL
ncbi:aspartate aminotransferase [Chimaeribacter arupi]|uniref:pyridoxal-phosphate-dependent aminotransferase family protein n=1 Tax=Chimaeribacter arupi TaxID=2060066 RepID=UPI000C7E649A|nr:aminotransferase class V-fold PLP-dependent enzyme [Chimaeribacter arupi]PLR47249.1 aspartate aminotransferase [Chimaeribacter arupi]